MAQARLVIISDVIRRDLQQPLGLFKNFEIIHLYKEAAYQDMSEADFKIVKTIKWTGLVDLWRQLKSYRPDIIQGAEPWATRASLGVSLVTYWYKIRFPRSKLIWPAVENRPLKTKFKFPINSLIIWWSGIYGRRSDLVMYRNQGSQKNLLACGIPRTKIDSVNWGTWGIDCQEFRPLPEITKSKEPLFLFVGKISVSKGVPWVLEAFKIIKKDYPEAKLVLAGQVIDIPLTSLDYPGIEYLGVVKNKNLPEIYNRASLVLAPSITTPEWEEQVGMVNLQAMACGTPVISTNSGAIPEYIVSGQGAVLVEEKDARALASQAIKLLKDREQYTLMSHVARKYIQDHYQIQDSIKTIEIRLKELLNDSINSQK
jgi:glycosyltransferase involved in cell wall biosynthesis